MPDNDTEPVIAIRDLVKSFPDQQGGSFRVLDGVSMDVYPGEIVVVMGGSGCGKSTLLNCLIGELCPEEGTIRYKTRDTDGPVDIHEISPRDFNELRKRFGILFQSAALFNSMTVAENVALPLQEHSDIESSVIEVVVRMKLEQVHMLPHADKMPSQLSGGQKKRAGLARATSLDPEILFYDEPSAGLDPVTSAAIDKLIMRLARGMNVTSLVVTHEMDSAFRIADRMFMLDHGRIVKSGPRSDFERIRDADPQTLANRDEQLVHQFLNGNPDGPLTDSDGVSEFEQWILSY